MRTKQADFNIWNSEHPKGMAYIEPNSKAAHDWMTSSFEGETSNAVTYQIGHADLDSMIDTVKRAGMVVAYKRPATA